MTYINLEDILADIGKPNVTAKHLITSAYKLGAGELEEEEEYKKSEKLVGAKEVEEEVVEEEEVEEIEERFDS